MKLKSTIKKRGGPNHDRTSTPQKMCIRDRPKTVVGLNLHISCLIERLVKKEEIKSYRDLERFCDCLLYTSRCV